MVMEGLMNLMVVARQAREKARGARGKARGHARTVTQELDRVNRHGRLLGAYVVDVLGDVYVCEFICKVGVCLYL